MHTPQRIRRLRTELQRQRQQRQFKAALAPRRLSGLAAIVLAAPAAKTVVGLDTSGLQGWLTKNAVPLGVLMIGIIIVFNARKKDHASTINMVGGAMIGLSVVGLAVSGFAPGLGTWMVGLIWHSSSTASTGN